MRARSPRPDRQHRIPDRHGIVQQPQVEMRRAIVVADDVDELMVDQDRLAPMRGQRPRGFGVLRQGLEFGLHFGPVAGDPEVFAGRKQPLGILPGRRN